MKYFFLAFIAYSNIDKHASYPLVNLLDFNEFLFIFQVDPNKQTYYLCYPSYD